MRPTRINYSVLLGALALLVCINAIIVIPVSSSHDLAIDVRAKRQLRTHMLVDDSDNTLEERTNINLSGTAGIKSLISKKAKQLAEKAKVIFTSNNQQTTNKLFIRFQVGTVKSRLLESSQYQKWSRSVYNAYRNSDESDIAIFTTLKAKYGDRDLAKLLAEARQVSTTMATAKSLENVQFGHWIKDKKTADDIFTLLRLNSAEANPLKNPTMSTWISYATKLKTENPYELLLQKLTNVYGEDKLTRVLLANRMDDTHTSSFIANRLEETRIDRWLKEGKSADDMFARFRFTIQEGDEILQNPALGTWFSYVHRLKESPQKILFIELRTRYSDEKLVDLLLAAQQYPNAQPYVNALTTELLAKWLKTDKSIDEVFKLLKLNNVEGDSILKSPGWGTWTSYASKMDRNNADELIFTVMKNHFSDEVLENIIAKAKTSIFTKDIAAKLQVEMWRSQAKTADEVFTLLKLDQKGRSIFDSYKSTVAVGTWVSFVNKLNKNNEFAVISNLEKRFGDAGLAMMLVEGMKKPSSTVVKGLQELQFKQWMTLNKKLNPNAVADKMLKYSNDPRSIRVTLNFRNYYNTKIQQ